MSHGEGDPPQHPAHAAHPPCSTSLEPTLTVSPRGCWRAKRRWWKPSGEGATQKPPAQRRAHERQRKGHQGWAHASHSCSGKRPAQLCARCLLPKQAPNDTATHFWASPRALQPAHDPGGSPSQGCTVPSLSPLQQCRCHTSGPGHAQDECQGQHVPADLACPSQTYHGGAAIQHSAADLW